MRSREAGATGLEGRILVLPNYMLQQTGATGIRLCTSIR